MITYGAAIRSMTPARATAHRLMARREGSGWVKALATAGFVTLGAALLAADMIGIIAAISAVTLGWAAIAAYRTTMFLMLGLLWFLPHAHHQHVKREKALVREVRRLRKETR